jgi:hypothetical protein
MPVTIRAHFDGTVIVPDETVHLPVDQPLVLEVRPLASAPEPSADELTIAQRLDRLTAASGRLSGPSTPAEALRCENLYEERVWESGWTPTSSSGMPCSPISGKNLC